MLSLSASIVLVACILPVALLPCLSVAGDKPPLVWSDQEKPIPAQLRGLRKLSDDVRTQTTKNLALQIRQLPVVPNKLRLASGLANLSISTMTGGRHHSRFSIA
jgi:hypothetical protein